MRACVLVSQQESRLVVVVFVLIIRLRCGGSEVRSQSLFVCRSAAVDQGGASRAGM